MTRLASHATPELLRRLGEPFAAGYVELPDTGPMRRWARAVRRRFEHRPAGPYSGERLYPCGPRLAGAAGAQNRILQPSYSSTWAWHQPAFEAAMEAAGPATRDALQELREGISALSARIDVSGAPHTVGGWGYTHSIPNYGRVLREGLDRYRERVIRARGMAPGEGADEFCQGLLDVLDGLSAWCRTLVQHLARWRPDDSAAGSRRDRLLAALEQVPFRPARTFFEAVVAYNLVYYFDDCDNPGRLDQELQPFYQADMDVGRIDAEGAAGLIQAFADNVCANQGWSAAVGGTTAAGAPGYNDVTQMLLAAAHGRFRPNLELRVRPDMPDTVWTAAFDAVASGAGNPAFYNETAYLQGLRDAELGLAEADLVQWNGGGCTETMIHGCSNVGSLEAGLNLLLIFEESLRKHLPTANSFESFLGACQQDVADTVASVAAAINRRQEAKAYWQPQPMRSLLVDDCIDRVVDFNAGGARYNWSVVNVAGLSNVVDSLAAVREVIFQTGELTPDELRDVLAADFAGHEPCRRRLAQCSRFGNDDSSVDALAARLAAHVFGELRRQRLWRGGRLLPACIMFVTYAQAGASVGATPDGRRAGEPLADSIGPVQGRDRRGPTAMLRSVSRLPLHLAVGTPVLNMRLTRELLRTGAGRTHLRHLIQTFFELGGMQLQFSVADRVELEDALVHPERHENLIVRIGGYSEYFNRLSPDLKRTVIERTEYGGPGQDPRTPPAAGDPP